MTTDRIDLPTGNPRRIIRVKLEEGQPGQAMEISTRVWHRKAAIGEIPTLKGFTLSIGKTREVARAMLEMADRAEAGGSTSPPGETDPPCLRSD